MPRIVLASASPARLATLQSAGVDPLVWVSEVDESATLSQAQERWGTLSPADAVLVLAQAKAEDVANAIPEEDVASGSLVVGCDSMLEFDGLLYGKPATPEEARVRWQAMRGNYGTLHTGHWVIDMRDLAEEGTGGTLGATASTTVHFADLSDAEIDAYIATGEPLAVAGGFTVDGLGGPYIERIEGDFHAVVGLSLPLLRELLGELQVSWHQLRLVEK